MDTEELLEQRARLERQRDAELKACRAKWRRMIDVIDQRLKATTASSCALGCDHGPARLPEVLDEVIEEDRKRGVMDVVRQSLENYDGAFTARTLVGIINKNKPSFLTERDVSNPLWRLRKLGIIKIIAKGKGRKPQEYLKI
jgi:hypothetical protein